MNLPEVLWTIAFCSFLPGGAWSIRTDGAWPAVALMGAGALLDAAVAFLPQMGVESLSYGLTRMNSLMLVSMGGGIVVYGLFLTGLWFLSFIGSLYALYINPDALMR